MRTWLAVAALGLLTAAGEAPAAAQEPPSAELPPPFSLSYVDGRADVARADGVVHAQAPDVLDAGDRLLVADGRAELVSAGGALVHVDRDADLHVDDDGRLRIVRGRIVIRTAPSDTPFDLVTPVGVARLEPRGEYVITARDLDGDVTIAAVTGRAALALPSTDVPIAADDVVAVDPRRLEPRWSRAGGQRDAFTDWAERRFTEMLQARGTQPLPVELTAYAPAFATYGRWDTLPVHGSVWFPTSAPGWRPYANGSWRHTRHGWTWIDSDPWGWPVHHYGRWGRHASRGWYWIPRRTWGPAWVGWAIHADYVGWSPLGWDSRPVVDFVGGARGGRYDLWAGSWSVVPRRAFGGHGPVGRYHTDPDRLPGPVRGGFVAQTRPPRGPSGWDRRLSPAPGYGRPTPAGRSPRADAGASGDRPGAGHEAVQRPRDLAGLVAPPPSPRDRAGDPRRWRSPSASADPWRAPGAADDATRVVAPRPGDARPEANQSADGRSGARAIAPARGDGRNYGRPAPPADGRAARPEAATARPRSGPAAARERSGSGAGRSAGTPTSGTARSGGSRGSSAGGNRRSR